MKANDIRKGAVIYYEGKPHLVMDFTHRTPGNLRAFVQVRLRNLKSGMSLDHRFSATENVEEARLDTRTVQVLYADAQRCACHGRQYLRAVHPRPRGRGR